MFQFASLPIELTMDDHGCHTYFSEENFKNRKPKIPIELQNQVGWYIFWNTLRTCKESVDRNNKPFNHSNWFRNMECNVSGIWSFDTSPTTWDYDIPIQWTAMTLYRKDIWDHLVNTKFDNTDTGWNDKFRENFTKQCQPISKEIKGKARKFIEEFNNIAHVTGDDCWTPLLGKIIRSGKCQQKFQDKYEVNFKLSNEQRQEAVSKALELYAFVRGLHSISRPILPECYIAPQAGFQDKVYRRNQEFFHTKCLKIIRTKS
jgi:hypothetical protein